MIDEEINKGSLHRTKIITDLLDIEHQMGYPANDMFWLLYNEEKSCLPITNTNYDNCMTDKYQKCYDRVELCVSSYVKNG